MRYRTPYVGERKQSKRSRRKIQIGKFQETYLKLCRRSRLDLSTGSCFSRLSSILNTRVVTRLRGDRYVMDITDITTLTRRVRPYSHDGI